MEAHLWKEIFNSRDRDWFGENGGVGIFFFFLCEIGWKENGLHVVNERKKASILTKADSRSKTSTRRTVFQLYWWRKVQPSRQLASDPTKKKDQELEVVMEWREYDDTINVVLADVMSCLVPGPGCGSSSSVIKKTRFVAVFGALFDWN